MAFPRTTTGSLTPAFASARPVCLAVKLPYAFTLYVRLPTVLREPLGASVTHLGGDRPSQTTHQTLSPIRIHGPGLELQQQKGGISRTTPPRLASGVSTSPTYPTHLKLKPNIKL